MGPTRVSRVLGLKPLALALAGLGALVGLGLEGLGAFLAHGFVDQEADAFGQAAAGALVSQELQNGVQEFRIGSVGRHGFALDVFGDTPTGNHYGPPSTSFGRRQPPFGGGCAPARYARLRSAAPAGGLGGRKKSHLQKEFYTPDVTSQADAQPYRTRRGGGAGIGLCRRGAVREGGVFQSPILKCQWGSAKGRGHSGAGGDSNG